MDLVFQEERPTAYLHQLVRDSRLELPTPPAPAPRDPELERRVQRLRKEQEQRQYQRMVANVAASSRKFDVDDESFAAQSRSRQTRLELVAPCQKKTNIQLAWFEHRQNWNPLVLT